MSRTFRPDVGDYMSDKAYAQFRAVAFKAQHAGTDPNEAERCRKALKNIVERDKIPAEEKAYRRSGESDAQFKARVNADKGKTFRQSTRQADRGGAAFDQYAREFDIRDQRRQNYEEQLKREREAFFRTLQDTEAMEASWQEIKAQQRQKIRTGWQQSSDELHSRYNRPYRPTGPRPRTNTVPRSQQESQINPFFLFIMLVIIYLVFFQ